MNTLCMYHSPTGTICEQELAVRDLVRSTTLVQTVCSNQEEMVVVNMGCRERGWREGAPDYTGLGKCAKTLVHNYFNKVMTS